MAPLASVPAQQRTAREPSRGPLRIAMIAPPYFTVPPSGYGGVEAMLADLVDGLVDRGHEITLIGAGRTGTRATRFLATTPDPPSQSLGEALPEIAHAAAAARLLNEIDVDLVHDHTLAGPLLARGRLTPTVVTVHSAVSDTAAHYYRDLGETVGLIAISDTQRAHAPHLAWIATVHNAVRVSTFPFRAEKEPFALFLGRFHPQKAPHLAIDAARAAGLPIVLAGKCSEPLELDYFDTFVSPRLGDDATVLGVADAATKRDLLARASCLLFPICWEEPFGLVMIEAMACGTPVVALRRGSVPEVVTDGRTGVIVDDPADLAAAIDVARRLDPAECRDRAQRLFDVPAMVSSYERVYRAVLQAIEEPRAPSAHRA